MLVLVSIPKDVQERSKSLIVLPGENHRARAGHPVTLTHPALRQRNHVLVSVGTQSGHGPPGRAPDGSDVDARSSLGNCQRINSSVKNKPVSLTKLA